MINRRTVLSAAAIAGVLALPLPATAEPTEINFGIISTESTQNLKTQWDPLLAEMVKKTGLKINPFFASDYAGIIEGMRFGKVQVAWYGNKSAMEAVDRADGEVFAQTVNPDGTQGYYGLLLANAANNGLNTVDDALKCDKSLTFGNGDPNSTSGFLVPSVFIFSAKGIDPKSCYKTVTNANHETNAMAVANGQVDIATNNTENMARIEENNPAAFKKIKIIWRSPFIPSDPIVWCKDLDQATKEKLMKFVIAYGRQGNTAEVETERRV